MNVNDTRNSITINIVITTLDFRKKLSDKSDFEKNDDFDDEN